MKQFNQSLRYIYTPKQYGNMSYGRPTERLPLVEHARTKVSKGTIRITYLNKGGAIFQQRRSLTTSKQFDRSYLLCELGKADIQICRLCQENLEKHNTFCCVAIITIRHKSFSRPFLTPTEIENKSPILILGVIKDLQRVSHSEEKRNRSTSATPLESYLTVTSID